jgi:hypothetical protein
MNYYSQLEISRWHIAELEKQSNRVYHKRLAMKKINKEQGNAKTDPYDIPKDFTSTCEDHEVFSDQKNYTLDCVCLCDLCTNLTCIQSKIWKAY